MSSEPRSPAYPAKSKTPFGTVRPTTGRLERLRIRPYAGFLFYCDARPGVLTGLDVASGRLRDLVPGLGGVDQTAC